MKVFYLIVAILSMVVFAEKGVNDLISEKEVWDRALNLLILGFLWPLTITMACVYEIVYHVQNYINKRNIRKS